jgi:hypothetical protein
MAGAGGVVKVCPFEGTGVGVCLRVVLLALSEEGGGFEEGREGDEGRCERAVLLEGSLQGLKR